MIKELIEAIKTFTPQQWGMVAAIIVGCYGVYQWMENRYAEKQMAELILKNVISIDSKITAVITTQHNEEEIKKINEAAVKFEEQMIKYLGTRNKNP